MHKHAVAHEYYKCVPVCVLCGSCSVSTGDVFALQELSACVSAFKESDSRGRLPLHAAAVQPQQEILRVVLQGERLGVRSVQRSEHPASAA